MDYEDIIHALKSGSVPQQGTTEICVGRDPEIKEFERLFDKIENDKAAIKFIEGDYGRGKSFLLKIIEEKALQRNFVVSKITVTKSVPFNKFEEVYKSIIQNLKCKTGTSLEHIIEKWLTELRFMAMDESMDPIKQTRIVRDNMKNDLESARKYSNPFAIAIEKYYNAAVYGDSETAHYAQAWLKGDSNIPFQQKKKFGVKGDVTKENVFSYLQAVAVFLKSIDYNGLVILIDEVEFIMSLHQQKLRDAAFDYIRYIYDECDARKFRGCLFVFAGTSEFYEDQRKGIPSYVALSSRIEDSLNNSHKDIRKTIMRLNGLERNELKELSLKLINIHSEVYNWDSESRMSAYVDAIIEDQESKALLTGGKVSPRKYVKDFISILDTVQQNPSKLNSEDEILRLFEEIETEEEW